MSWQLILGSKFVLLCVCYTLYSNLYLLHFVLLYCIHSALCSTAVATFVELRWSVAVLTEQWDISMQIY